MTVKAIVEWARAVPGYAGLAVLAGGTELFGENVEPEYASAIRDLLAASPGALRASAAVRGLTFTAFKADDLVVLLKVAGRFPALPSISVEEPSFVDPSCVPALPSRDEARREAEAALHRFGIL